MKKLTILLMAMMMPMMMQAQAKRRPAGNKAATAAKKPATKANNNFAILQLDEWINQSLFEDEENIYFLGYDSPDKNTLRAVNKQTGEIKLVIPKKKRARPIINSAGSDGKSLFFRCMDEGIYRYNGTDIRSSELIIKQTKPDEGYLWKAHTGNGIVFSPNGRYMCFLAGPTILFDLEQNKVVRWTMDEPQDAVVANDGTTFKMCSIHFFRIPNTGKTHLNNSNPINREGVEKFDNKIGNGGGGDPEGCWLDADANMFYVAMGEQVLRTPVDHVAWEEVYCLPGENKKFTHYVCNGQRVFATTDNYEKKFYEWDNKDMKGEPKISKEIDTGIEIKSAWSVSKEKFSDVRRLYYDKAGNLWIQVNDGRFVIYNPDGIKGLTSLKGKVTENNLPKEED